MLLSFLFFSFCRDIRSPSGKISLAFQFCLLSHLYTMPLISRFWAALSFRQLVLVAGQQQCYVGAGAENRGPPSLVPCLSSGESACCLLGDTCLSGNTCYNFETGDLYQYGCTDITYTNSVCPYKCGWNSSKFDDTRGMKHAC